MTAARYLSGDHFPQLDDGMVGGKLLNFLFDLGLRRELDENLAAQQNVAVQLSLSRTVAADCVYMYARSDHIVGQYGGILLVGGNRRHDLRALNRVFCTTSDSHLETMVGKVSKAFFDRGRVDIVKRQLTDAQKSLKRESLEFGLRAVADDHHASRVLGREMGAEFRNATVRAFVQIEVTGRMGDRVTQHRLQIGEVQTVHSTNGRWDLIAELEASDFRSFDDVLRKIRLIDGANLTESGILLSSRQSRVL